MAQPIMMVSLHTAHRSPMVAIVECATMRAPHYMLNYQKNMESTTDIDVYINNAIQVISDFMELITRYGDFDCIGKPAPHDKRFKLGNNGSYYDLAGYTFVYEYIHDENKNLTKYWQCINYEAHVRVRVREDLETITKGEVIVMHKLGEI